MKVRDHDTFHEVKREGWLAYMVDYALPTAAAVSLKPHLSTSIHVSNGNMHSPSG